MFRLKPLNPLADRDPKGFVTLDSRKAKPGVIFVASKGATPNSKDGHDFIQQALSNNCSGLIIERTDIEIPTHIPVWLAGNSRIAAAILSEQALGAPSKALNLCGVTGTNGKTTVTFLLASIANAFGRKAAVLGTLGSGPLDNLQYFGFTTPEAENISAYLKDLKDQHFEQVAMEVSSHALATYRVDGLTFKAAAFTNLSQDHLDFHGNLENYLKAKARLFTELLPEDGVAVLPETSPLAPLHQVERGKTLHWGYTSNSDIEASDIKLSDYGIRFKLRIKNQTAEIKSPLFGRFNIDNMLCAAGLAYATEIPIEAIAAGLSQAVIPKGRLERVSPSKPAVFVDFAHTPDALSKTLQTLREICKAKLIVVFGCGGDRDRTKRPLMTQIAAQYADLTVITLDNPRHEKPEQIIADMSPLPNMLVILEREKAIKHAIFTANPDDMILIAGKGHETTQQIGDEYRPFDDAKIAHEVLLHRHQNPETR
ncbi:MAG: UDP-N-acetylmuramoyl-L-alanyl-D-glutamate--2,6-diaminopimelate ligase [Myxococcaceae bacterium]